MNDYTMIFSRAGQLKSDVCVIISLFNYENYIVETLDSVLAQTEPVLDLVIIDDASTDHSREIAATWLKAHQSRFNNLNLVGYDHNGGAAAARNMAFSIAQTDYVFVLDADNAIYPRCIARCLHAIKAANAAFAYTIIERYDNDTGEPNEPAPLMGMESWNRARLVHGNYIDAMALIKRSAWAAVGGYRIMKNGWEDYDLWCKFAENDLTGIHVPEILCRYRVHKTSMTNTATQLNLSKVADDMMKNHPWLDLSSFEVATDV